MTLPAFPSPCCGAAAAERRRLLHGAPAACAGSSAANPPHAAAAVDRWDRQTERQADRRSTFYRHCSAYYVGYSRSLSHHLSVNYEFQSREGKLLQRGSQWYTVDLQDTLTTNSQCSPVVLTPLITLV